MELLQSTRPFYLVALPLTHQKHELTSNGEQLSLNAPLASLLGVASCAYADVPDLLRPHLFPPEPVHLVHRLQYAPAHLCSPFKAAQVVGGTTGDMVRDERRRAAPSRTLQCRTQSRGRPVGLKGRSFSVWYT